MDNKIFNDAHRYTKALTSHNDSLLQTEITKSEMILNDAGATAEEKFNAAHRLNVAKLRQIKDREQRKRELEKMQRETAEILAQEKAVQIIYNEFNGGKAAGKFIADLIDQSIKAIQKGLND